MAKIEYEDLTLELDEEENYYVIVGCDKDATSVKIPAKVNGIYVKEIGYCAFANCRYLQSVEFPDYEDEDYLNDGIIKSIGDNAFMDCYLLEKIDIPFGVTMIGHGAFYGCRSLKEATFNPEAYLAMCAFSDCSSLVKVTNTDCISESVFDGCESLTYLPLADGVDEIGESAFAHCTSLESVVIPKTVESIEQLAFRSCYNLKSVKFEVEDGWYVSFGSGYEARELDLSNPENNARWLREMDFDDGVRRWKRGKKGW